VVGSTTEKEIEGCPPRYPQVILGSEARITSLRKMTWAKERASEGIRGERGVKGYETRRNAFKEIQVPLKDSEKTPGRTVSGGKRGRIKLEKGKLGAEILQEDREINRRGRLVEVSSG